MHGPVGRRGSVDRDETCGTGSCGQPAVTSVGGGIAEDPAGPGGLDLPTTHPQMSEKDYGSDGP